MMKVDGGLCGRGDVGGEVAENPQKVFVINALATIKTKKRNVKRKKDVLLC